MTNHGISELAHGCSRWSASRKLNTWKYSARHGLLVFRPDMSAIRIRCASNQHPPLTDPILAHDLVGAVRRYYDLEKWWCELVVLMPDHLHAMLAFPVARGFAKTVRDWKRGTARFQGVRWQENFFDHRIRHAAEESETWWYLRRNPVAKGLCAGEDDWPWLVEWGW